MKPEELREANELLSTHTSLRYNIARNGSRRLSLYAHDDDKRTSQPSFPPAIGRQVLYVSLGLVENRLRELGVDPEVGLEVDCMHCGGDGKEDMGRG